MRKFYEDIEHKKEQELLQDMQNRKHHDTLLPTQKSPIPLNRYEELDNGVNTPASTLNRSAASGSTYKMVGRALYNFQAQNYRELSFKKGDLVYIRRQVDDNWYEGERNAMIGIFPVTYVEIVPNENVGSMSRKSTLGRASSTEPQAEGKGKAKFNFQAQTPMELSLIKGEIVVLTRRVDQNWYEGRIGSRKGIFPSSYIEVLLEPGEPRGNENSSDFCKQTADSEGLFCRTFSSSHYQTSGSSSRPFHFEKWKLACTILQSKLQCDQSLFHH